LAGQLHLFVGIGYRSLQRFDVASHHLQRANQILEANLAGSDQEVLEVRLQLALLLADQNEHEAAAADLRRLLVVAEQTHGKDERLSLHIRYKLVKVLEELQRTNEAQTLAQQGATLAEARFGLSDILTLQLRDAALGAFTDQSQYERILRSKKELLDTLTRELGSTHHLTLTVAAQTAGLMALGGEDVGGIAFLRPIVAEARAKHGDEYVYTQMPMMALAVMLARSGEVAEAAELMRAVWQAQERQVGQAHIISLTSRMGYARLLLPLGRHDEAADILRQGLRIAEASLDQSSQITADYQNALAAVLQILHQGDDEVADLRIQLSNHERQFGRTDPNVMAALWRLLIALEDRKRWLEANEVAEDLVARTRETVGTNHTFTATSMVHHGWTLLNLGWLDQAEPVLIRAYDIQLNANTQQAKRDMKLCLGLLSMLYRAQGDSEKADHYSRLEEQLPSAVAPRTKEEPPQPPTSEPDP
jgi:tetratricopeptide (TPR) repeat protein